MVRSQTLSIPKTKGSPTSYRMTDRQEKNAISVIIPLKIARYESGEAQELSLDVDTVNIPVTRNKRKRRRKLSTKGRKVPQSEPQHKTWERKSSTKGRELRQQKPKREQQACVGKTSIRGGKTKA